MDKVVEWGEVIGVWYDLVDGRPEIDVVMLPGAKTGFVIAKILTNDNYYLAFGEDESRVPRDSEELDLVLRQKNIPFGLFRADLRKRKNLEKLYAWHTKSVEQQGYILCLVVVDVDATPLQQLGAHCVLDEGEEAFHREVLDRLREEYGPRQPPIRDSSLGFEMLGPTYLLKP